MAIKGTTKIELKDVKTGKVETYENHNMITNALTDIFKPLGLSNRPSRYFSDFVPYYEKLLGGILCFDTAIEENPDNYYASANANLIRCASYGVQNNTKNTCGGGFTSYGYKDTVCNTSYPLMQGIAEDTLQYVHPDRTGASTSSRYSGTTIGTTEMIFLIDREQDCAYYFKVVDKTHIHITKRRTFLKSVSVLDNIYSKKPLINEVELKELTSKLRMSYWSYNHDPTNDCLYICTTASSTVAPNGTYLVTEIKLDSWEVKQYEVTNTTDVTLISDSYWHMYVAEGYLFVKSYNSPYELYKIQITNPANVVKFKRINTGTVSGHPKAYVNGRIYYECNDDQLLIANTVTNEIMPPEAKSFFNSSYEMNLTPVRNEPLLYFGDYGTWSTAGWYMMCNYLATINNLDTPVTKTADRTMKITYILQE